MNRFKLILAAGVATCAFGLLPATASAAESGPCLKDFCPIDFAQAYANYVIDTAESEYDRAIATAGQEAGELLVFVGAVEDAAFDYVCGQLPDTMECSRG